MRTLRPAAVLAIIGVVALSAVVVNGNPTLGLAPTPPADAPASDGAPRPPNDLAMRVPSLPYAWPTPPVDKLLPTALPITPPWLLPDSLQALSADGHRIANLAMPAGWGNDLDVAQRPDDLTWPGLPERVAWALLNNDIASFEQVANSSWQLRPADETGRGAVGGNTAVALNGLVLTQTAAVPEPGTVALWALGLLAALLASRRGTAIPRPSAAGRA